MGSYLTIINDTPDEWQCKIGPDLHAIKIASIVIAILAAAVGLIMISSVLAPVVAAVAATTTVVWGVPIEALVSTTRFATESVFGAEVIGTSSGFSIIVAEEVSKKLNSKGYDTILSGDSHRYGKMTLSLWQQSICRKTTTTGSMVDIYTLYMRPIFSGSTLNSNRNHSIQYWINKHGTSKYTIDGTNETKTPSGDTDVVFYPNRTDTRNLNMA